MCRPTVTSESLVPRTVSTSDDQELQGTVFVEGSLRSERGQKKQDESFHGDPKGLVRSPSYQGLNGSGNLGVRGVPELRKVGRLHKRTGCRPRTTASVDGLKVVPTDVTDTGLCLLPDRRVIEKEILFLCKSSSEGICM